MAPPAKGTDAYKTYLRKQKQRKATQRAIKRHDKLRKRAAPLVKAAVYATTKELDKAKALEIQKKNQLMRKNHELTYANTRLLAHNTALEQKLTLMAEKLVQAQAEAKASHGQLVEAKNAAKECQQRLSKWDTWWMRLQARVGQHFLDKFKWLGRPRDQHQIAAGGGQ